MFPSRQVLLCARQNHIGAEAREQGGVLAHVALQREDTDPSATSHARRGGAVPGGH